jgi:phosphoglycolate phosphatase-like HAD superfamily hydrolase
VRIAIDIDSTLHHYWDQLDAVAQRRFGVALPYAEQATWEIEALAPEQVRAAVAETHGEEHVLAAVPYPGAVEAVRDWHEAGHFIHVTSHRAASATAPRSAGSPRSACPTTSSTAPTTSSPALARSGSTC